MALPENAPLWRGWECLLPSPPPGAMAYVQQSNRRGRGDGGEGAAWERTTKKAAPTIPPSPPTPLPPPAMSLQNASPSRRRERGDNPPREDSIKPNTHFPDEPEKAARLDTATGKRG